MSFMVKSYAIQLFLPAKILYGEDRPQEEGYWKMARRAKTQKEEEDEETEIRNWAGQEDHAAYAPALCMHMLPG